MTLRTFGTLGTLCTLLLLLGCPTTGGPSYAPADCKADVEMAEFIAKRIIDRTAGESVDPVDYALYSSVAKLLARRGCDFVPVDLPEPDGE